MAEYVAVDSSSPHGGTDVYHVGVAVEVANSSLFDEHYFDVMGSFLSSHGIYTPFGVVKSRSIVNQVPSYKLRTEMGSLVRGLVNNPGISRINVTVGWYNSEVDLAYNDSAPMNGNTFTAKFLKHYFNVVTLWQYHRSHRYNIPDRALLDEISGKITGSWQYVGNEFDLDIVPNGDLTYPAISTADILAYNIQGVLNGSNATKFLEYPEIAESYLINQRDNDMEIWIDGNHVNETHEDQIVPTLPYPIKSVVHHPHPILFVYDDVFSTNEVVVETDFHAYCRKWAYEREGAVVTWDQENPHPVIHDGDTIVHTVGTNPSPVELLSELNPDRDFAVVDSNDLLGSIS